MSDHENSSKALATLERIHSTLVNANPRAELSSLGVLLEVMKAHPNAIEQRSLSDLVDMNAVTVSRNVSIWTKRRYKDSRIRKQSPGLGLIQQIEDPDDRRTNLLRLTPKGVKLRDKLISTLNSN